MSQIDAYIFSYADTDERDIKIFANREDIWSKVSDPASYPPEPVDESTFTEEYSVPLDEQEYLALVNWCERYHITVDKWARAMLQFYVQPGNREIVEQVVKDGKMRFNEKDTEKCD